MTAAEQMRALAADLSSGALRNEGLWPTETDAVERAIAALQAAADQLDAAQKWLDQADTLVQGDSPYLPDLQDIIDGDHGRDCASGTMANVEEFFPCSCWKADL